MLMIDEVVPSDGGLYSCMAVSSSGNASRDVAIYSKSLSLSYMVKWRKCLYTLFIIPVHVTVPFISICVLLFPFSFF